MLTRNQDLISDKEVTHGSKILAINVPRSQARRIFLVAGGNGRRGGNSGPGSRFCNGTEIGCYGLWR